MPREFILFSRLGRTDARFRNLHDAGRLDIVYECIVASLFLSHGIRKDVTFHVILNGPPKPPIHVQINGQTLHDVRTDQQTWDQILKNLLLSKSHPGIETSRTGFETILRTKAQTSPIYVLEEGGEEIGRTTIESDPVFVLGDHIGLPKTAERFALRFGRKISLGKQPYLAASCITIINYLLDASEYTQRSKERQGSGDR
jgi:tRNA (pseudouridine54-N1)-methyltransferase